MYILNTGNPQSFFLLCVTDESMDSEFPEGSRTLCCEVGKRLRG